MNRRGLWESAQRQAAIQSKIKPFDVPHMGDNASCVTIKADGLIVTGHFVDGPNQIPREAESRKQNEAVNRYLGYYTDERLLTQPLPKLEKKPVYLNILHGAHFPCLKSDKPEIDVTTCFLRAAIPHEGRLIFNWSVDELLLHYAAKQTSEQGLLDRAHPRRKKRGPDDEKRKTGNEGR